MASSLCDFLVKQSSKTQGKILFKVFETLTCSICHECMYVPMMTQCGHNYCYDCLCAWFESNPEEELSCPQCRASVISTPALNSALQQWLHAVFEVLEEEEDDDDDDDDDDEKEVVSQMMEARRKCEQHYKQDEKKDNLFNGLFKNTAVGIVDKDDDGILRCSNCHWELEDDEDDVCPHCSFRIRGRQVGGRTGTESEEEYSSDEYPRGRREPSLVAYAEYATEYIAYAMGFMRKVNDLESITNEEVDDDSPFRFNKYTFSDETVVYYPSFSAYYYFSYSSCLMNRQIFIRIIRELETRNLNESELEQFIQAEYHSYQEKSHDGVNAAAFEAKVRCLESAAREYRTAIVGLAERLKSINDPSLEEFAVRFPLMMKKSLENNTTLLIPSYSLLAQYDYTLSSEEREIVVPMVKHLESTSFNHRHHHHHHHHPAEEEDSSMDDFIASDDDETPHNNLVYLDASEHSSEGGSNNSNSEELDSDYFERNEGDGFVSGDSLDDGHRDHRETSEEEEDEREDEDEDEDGDGNLNLVHKARKRHRAIVDVSEDESM